jgi:murein DD-endopeptidase MepM/ murein hydrolase activator NlpD
MRFERLRQQGFQPTLQSGQGARLRKQPGKPAAAYNVVYFQWLIHSFFGGVGMNIILFTNRRGQVWNFEFRPARVAVSALLGLVAMVLAALWTGIHMGQDKLGHLQDWYQKSQYQQSEVRRLRDSARADLAALTLRIGDLQGQMMRLNALGERLVEQGGLDDGEFDFTAVPAVGGPETTELAATPPLAEVLATLDSLDAEIEDRAGKLSVLESVLMSRSLSERVTPSGRPVGEGWLSSRFGKRSDPFSGKQEFHKGLDFAGKQGTDVVAVGDGVVSWAGERSGYGKLVEINHGNGYVTRYGHNQKNLVKAGDTVKKGQLIALMGSTGRSTGPHVHFEVLANGKQVNPSRYISD